MGKSSLPEDQQRLVDLSRFRAVGRECGADDADMQGLDKEIETLDKSATGRAHG